jgi:hypothetical protein
LVAEPFTETEDSAMTDEMMTVRAVLEKSSDADLLREMIGFIALTSDTGGRSSGARAACNLPVALFFPSNCHQSRMKEESPTFQALRI